MEQNSKPIQPFPRPHQSLNPESNAYPAQTAEVPRTKRRRPTASIACERCRARKTGCDGARPSCTPCQVRKVSCSYRPPKHMATEELRRRLGSHQELLSHLRSLPEDEAIQLLRQLRSASDLDAFLISSEGGPANALVRPSDLRTARWAGPPADSDTEFELMARHPAAYLKIMPVNTPFLEQIVNMCRSPSPQLVAATLDSDSGSNPWSLPSNISPMLPWQNGSQGSVTTTGSLPDSSLTETHLDSYSNRASVIRTSPSPLPQGEYCDERLGRLQLDYWTRVPVADDFAASVISAFLVKDHSLMGIFDADLVIHDLVNYETDYCSPFFVSALMSIACQSYISVDRRAAPLSLCFIKEAEMLYRGEATVDSITTVAAIMLLCGCSLFAGRDSLGKELVESARHMGERLGLFGIPPHSPIARSFHDKPPQWVKAASHAAWGAFNYLGIYVMFYRSEPIRFPPTLPIPGEPIEVTRKFANHEGITPDWPQQPPPRHTSPFFHVCCRLWAIADEIALVYKSNSNNDIPVAEQVPLSFVEAKFRRLLDCMDQLKGDIVHEGHCPIQAVILHIQFHVIVLNALHPFIQDSAKVGRLQSFMSLTSSPKAIYAASVNQLKQLTLWAHLQHGKTISVYVNLGFLVLVGALLKDDNGQVGPVQRLYFLLCIKCCADLEISYPIFLDLARAFLVMALQRGAVSAPEALSLLEFLKERGSHHVAADEAVISCFPNLDLANMGTDSASTQAMARLFDELNLFNEYTTNDDYFAPHAGERNNPMS